jgi:NarL family two-component system response regulator LiaR
LLVRKRSPFENSLETMHSGIVIFLSTCYAFRDGHATPWRSFLSEPIRVLVAEDHVIVRAGLVSLIATEDGLEVVGQAGDGQEAVQKARECQPDVILMDLAMPKLDGIGAIMAIRQEHPRARVLVLTSFIEDEKVFAALKAGALGYLLKESSPDDLLRGIRAVYRGESWLHPAIAARLVRELSAPQAPPLQDPLTERELEVLRLVAQGLANKLIADRLEISERTARTHVSNILEKLHLSNRTQATLYAIKKGLVNNQED